MVQYTNIKTHQVFYMYKVTDSRAVVGGVIAAKDNVLE